jgi:hypothetical protein
MTGALVSSKQAAILVRPFHDLKEVTVCVDLQREAPKCCLPKSS